MPRAGHASARGEGRVLITCLGDLTPCILDGRAVIWDCISGIPPGPAEGEFLERKVRLFPGVHRACILSRFGEVQRTRKLRRVCSSGFLLREEDDAYSKGASSAERLRAFGFAGERLESLWGIVRAFPRGRAEKVLRNHLRYNSKGTSPLMRGRTFS